jgi:hypothetical protein
MSHLTWRVKPRPEHNIDAEPWVVAGIVQGCVMLRVGYLKGGF